MRKARLLTMVFLMGVLSVSANPSSISEDSEAASMSSETASAGNNGIWPTLTGFVRKVGAFIDTLSIKGLDRRYIEAPKKPWQVILRGNINQSDLKLSTSTDAAQDVMPLFVGDLTWEPRIKTNPATYLGFWAGYRGYGFGYSWNVGGDKGRILTFGATGGSYGVNLRIHWFDNDEPEVYMKGNGLNDVTDAGEEIYAPIEYNGPVEIGSPIKTRALFLDGYYLFNKRCSYAAAYDQSVIQKRSSGSLMAGAMYLHSSTEYDDDINADLIMLMNDIGIFKSDQVSVGVGYIYNWVPAKGLLVSAMALPMLAFYNRHQIWYFNSTLRNVMREEGWMDSMAMGVDLYKIWLNNQEDYNSNMKLNVDARLSITYEWGERLFINAFGQFCNFNYKTDYMKGRLNEWYINASIGVRL
jgi:hypothetical protein